MIRELIAPPLADQNRALDLGFQQCVVALRRILLTAPLGMSLVAWICWGRAPTASIFIWLALFAGGLAVNLSVLAVIVRQGAQRARHGRWLLGVAAIDGLSWGAVLALLTGQDAVLNAWMAALICGVCAVNAPGYITQIRAYRGMTGAVWAVLAVLAITQSERPQMQVTVVGLSLFVLLMNIYMSSIAARVVEGIRLQLANAELAEQLRTALASSQQEAVTDPLTTLPNRRALDDLLRKQLSLAAHRRAGFGVLMLDLDHFKSINDNHGHTVGDEVLRAFATRVRGLLREGDVCSRYGGEEFVVVLPGATLELALDVAERLRASVAEAPLLKAPALTVTVSVGAAIHRVGEGAQDLLERADAAVYDAKRAGRNRVCAAP